MRSSLDGSEVLEALDTNGDGRIDAQDEEFGKLRVWRDVDGDGVSDEGELHSLTELEIIAIELTRAAINGTNNGHGVGFQADFIRDDETTGIAQTIYFQTDRADTADPTPEFTAASGVGKLPQLQRAGELLSLDYVLSNDSSFRTDWATLADTAGTLSTDELRQEFEGLLLRWAGVDSVDPHDRGQYVDGRHLAFVEKFFGDTYREIQRGQEVGTHPRNASRGAAVEANFSNIVTVLELAFLAQLATSAIARSVDPAAAGEAAIASPYLAYTLLDFRTTIPAGQQASPTPGNLGMVVDLILALKPEGFAVQSTICKRLYPASRAWPTLPSTARRRTTPSSWRR
jgi:hypothetical protein